MERPTQAQREFLSFVRREALDGPDLEILDSHEPNLHKEIFPWTGAPAMPVDNVSVPTEIPPELWITDTTFRDGQQAREPYTPEQMVHLYRLLEKLGGPRGRISMTEFFLYTKRDLDTVRECLGLGGTPKVTAWIRASSQDAKLFAETSRSLRKETGYELDETGILTSVSDYHLFYKYGRKGRKEVVHGYLDLVEEILAAGFACRCHLEDSTRSDVFRVVVPFVRRLMRLSEKYARPVVIRYPDTVGVGVPWDFVSLPRSIPKLTYVLRNVCGVPAEWLEFHGHQDLHLGVANATSAWLHGAARNNGTLLGIGERAGNVPVEALAFMYAGIRGSFDGMDTRAITEIAEFYERELGHPHPEFAPITGRNFAVTRAGVHADGVLKNVEMYLPFDTESLLGVSPRVAITPYSGAAGVAFWLNTRNGRTLGSRFEKEDPFVQRLALDIREIFEGGRTTSLSDREMERLVEKRVAPRDAAVEAPRLSG